MLINTGSGQPLARRRPSPPPAVAGDSPQGLGRELLPAGGGLVLGGAAGYLGAQASKAMADYAMKNGLRWVLQGSIGPQMALKLLPYVRDRAFVTTAGALTFGLAGFALGAYLLWPREEPASANPGGH